MAKIEGKILDLPVSFFKKLPDCYDHLSLEELRKILIFLENSFLKIVEERVGQEQPLDEKFEKLQELLLEILKIY